MQTSEHKERDLVRQLYQRTLDGRISWGQTADDDIYLAAFPDYTVELVRVSDHIYGEHVTKDYLLVIRNELGSKAAQISSEDLSSTDDFEPYKLFHEMFVQAQRQTAGADRAIEGVLRRLQKMDVVTASDKGNN